MIVETVGVGQVEVEIASQADTTIVVVNPGWGDEVQAAKAGLLEVADIFVVNKADRPGADATVSDLGGMLELSAGRGWQPPIVRTVATDGDGVDELWEQIRAHRAFLESDGAVAKRRHARVAAELRALVVEQLLARWGGVTEGAQFDALVDAVAAGATDPYTAVDTLLSDEGERAPARRSCSPTRRDGSFPAFDGRVEVLPSPGPPVDALVAFTGHFVLAAAVEARAVEARMPHGELRVPFSPAALVWLTERLGRRAVDARRPARGAAAPARARRRGCARDDGFAHARVDEAQRHRTVEGVWTDGAGSLVLVGRGLCGRWEVGYEVAPEQRGRGLGRRLVAAACGLVPAGEPLWAQVAPGNAASMRSTLAAGFVPVGAEVLFAPSH